MKRKLPAALTLRAGVAAMTHWKSNLPTLSVLYLLALLPASAAEPETPAPAIPSAVTFVSRQEISSNLQKSIASQADPALATIGVTDTFQIHEVHRGHEGPPAIHPRSSELHFILEGSATFVTGGVIKKLPGNGATIIDGGVARTVTKGDAVIVPPNTPHWYSKVNGSVTYLEVRFVTPTAAPPAK